MPLRALYLISIVLHFLMTSPNSQADQLGLESGLMIRGALPFGVTESEKYFAFGLMAHASYEFDQWGIGVSTRGQVSAAAPVRVTTDSINVSGDLSRRFISLGVVARRFLPWRPGGGTTYIEGGFFGIQNDLVGASEIFDFELDEGQESLFIRGYGLSIGGGYRFQNSPLFLQLNYEYQKYNRAELVGKRNMLNFVVTDRQLENIIHVHTVFITVGIAGIF